MDPDENNALFVATLQGKSRAELKQIQEKQHLKWKVENKLGENILHVAARGGNIDAIEYFVSLGADIKHKDKNGETPLLKASLNSTNFIKTMDTLLEQKGCIRNAVDNYGNNLAFLAALRGRLEEELKHICKVKINWRRTNKNGENILHLAAQGGNATAIKFFISACANQNARDKSGQKPLHHVMRAKQNFEKCLLELTEVKDAINDADNHDPQNYLLFLAAENGRNRNELEQVVTLGGEWNVQNSDGEGILHYAVKGGNAEALNYFVELGADIESTDSNGRTPLLHVASIKQNFTETLMALLRLHADFNATDNHGNNLIFLALSNPNRSMAEIEEIVSCPVKWNVKNNEGFSVIHAAVLAGNADAIRYFKSRGADINGEDDKWVRPVSYVPTLTQNFRETLTALLENGAWINEQERVQFLKMVDTYPHLRLNENQKTKLKQLIQGAVKSN